MAARIFPSEHDRTWCGLLGSLQRVQKHGSRSCMLACPRLPAYNRAHLTGSTIQVRCLRQNDATRGGILISVPENHQTRFPLFSGNTPEIFDGSKRTARTISSGSRKRKGPVTTCICHLHHCPIRGARRRRGEQASKHLEFAAASSATALTSSCDTVGRILAGHLEAREYGAHDSMGLKGDGPGCHALTVLGPGEREAEGESGDVPIGDDKVARGAANIQEWKAGQSRSPHAGNRGLDIGAIFLWPCSLPRRRFGTVRLAMWHYCGV